jgi:hypothetical protein
MPHRCLHVAASVHVVWCRPPGMLPRAVAWTAVVAVLTFSGVLMHRRHDQDARAVVDAMSKGKHVHAHSTGRVQSNTFCTPATASWPVRHLDRRVRHTNIHHMLCVWLSMQVPCHIVRRRTSHSSLRHQSRRRCLQTLTQLTACHQSQQYQNRPQRSCTDLRASMQV